MKVWQIVSICLIFCINSQAITENLVVTQTLSAINGGTATAPALVEYTNGGNTLAAAVANTIYFFSRNLGTGQWENAYSLVMPGTVTALDFSPNDQTATVLTTSSNNILFLGSNLTSGRYYINQTVSTGTPQPMTVSYVGLGEAPVVGFNNGTIMVFNLISTGTWNATQSINSGFTSVAASDARNTRYVACDGGATGKVVVYYWNYTTSQLEASLLANNLTTTATVGCSALTLSDDQRRIAVGYTDGRVARIGQSGANNTYVIPAVGAIIAAGSTGTGATPSIVDLVYNRFGNYLVTCNAAGLLYTHQVNDGATGIDSQANIPPPATCRSVAYNNATTQFAVGNTAGTGGRVEVGTIDADCPVAGTTGYLADTATTDARCTCDEPNGYFWFNGACRQIDCFSDLNRNPTITATSLTTTTAGCSCASGFAWNTSLYMCTRQCSTTLNAAINNTNFEKDSCYCNTGFVWDQTTSTCGSYLNCAAIGGTTGVNVNSTTCGCATGYFFNTVTNTCNRNCTGISGATLSTTDPTKCVCTASGSTFLETFNSTTGLTGACGVNCSNYVRTTGQATATTCSCLNGFFWDSTNLRCQVDCHTLAYSVGCITGTANECKCARRTRWDPLLSQCIGNYHWTNPAAIAVPIAVPLGVLGLLGLLASILFCLPACCAAPIPVGVPVAVPTAVSAAPIITQAAPVVSNVQPVIQSVPRIIQQPVQQIVQPVQRYLPKIEQLARPVTTTTLNPIGMNGMNPLGMNGINPTGLQGLIAPNRL